MYFKSPFFVYAITWSVVLILYQLNISVLYPKLESKFLIFIIISIFLNLFIGVIFIKKIEESYRTKNVSKFNSCKLIILLFLMYGIDFIYAKDIPLISSLLKNDYSYRDFRGIPLFHGFLYSLSFYLSIKSWYLYVKYSDKKYLKVYLVSLLFPILSYSRGFVLLSFISALLIYLLENSKYIKKFIILSIISLYLFGIAGNIRHHYKAFDTTMIKKFLKIEKKESILDPFYWGYIYITSPLANLELNIEKNFYQKNFQKFILINFLPDFISEKLIFESIPTKRIIHNLTASTVYIEAYNTFGILGNVSILNI